MSHLIFILITSVLSITFQGRRIFNIHRNIQLPPGDDTPIGPRNIYTTPPSAVIAYTKRILIDDDADLVDAGTSGMGGMAKGKGKEGG